MAGGERYISADKCDGLEEGPATGPSSGDCGVIGCRSAANACCRSSMVVARCKGGPRTNVTLAEASVGFFSCASPSV